MMLIANSQGFHNQKIAEAGAETHNQLGVFEMPAPPMGDNGGPPLETFTAKSKLEQLRWLMERADLTSAQKCIGVAIVLFCQKDGTAFLPTKEIQRLASTRDRETVFRATKRLQEVSFIRKVSDRGQAGAFTVLPQRVVDAVVKAAEELRTSRGNADRSKAEVVGVMPTGPVGVVPTTPVGRLPTSPVGLVPTTSTVGMPTGRGSADQFPRADVYNNNKLYNTNNQLTNQPTTVVTEAARESSDLNGTRNLVLAKISDWMGPLNFGGERPEDVLDALLLSFGAQIVKEAFAELVAQIGDGYQVAKPLGVLNAICAEKLAGKSQPPKPSRSRTSNGARLNPDWTLPPAWREWVKINFCRATDEQISIAADEFRDFWIAKTGSDATKADWEATWRNWCRKAFVQGRVGLTFTPKKKIQPTRYGK